MKSDITAQDKPLRLAIELTSAQTVQDDSEPAAAMSAVREFDIEGNPAPSEPDSLRRIRAGDLRAAQKERIRIRRELQETGRDPGSVYVLVDIAVLIDPDARLARAELSSLAEQPDPHSLQYVGTPAGLAGLIADIKVAGVADGVTLRPIGGRSVIRHIFRETVPWLEERGLLQSRVEVLLSDDGVGPTPRISHSV